MDRTIFRLPSALAPLAMSLLALAVVVGHLALAGAAPQIDEGPAAHIFQLLLAGQAPVVAFFAIKWLPRLPAEAMMMIGLQAGAAMLALVPVIVFDL
jgi:hypothetical protein